MPCFKQSSLNSATIRFRSCPFAWRPDQLGRRAIFVFRGQQHLVGVVSQFHHCDVRMDLCLLVCKSDPAAVIASPSWHIRTDRRNARILYLPRR